MGGWDLYVTAAERYHWTPAQVDACDPDFLVELQGFWLGKAEHDRREAARREAEARRHARKG